MNARYLRTAIVGGGLMFIAIGMAMSPVSSSQEAQTRAKQARRVVKIYNQYCAPCHGEDGKGDGPAAADLTQKPPDFSKVSFHKKHSKEKIMRVIKKGKGLCPPHEGQLRDEVVEALADYLRTFVAADFNARAFYQKSCAPCHGRAGRGDGPLAATLPTPPTAFAKVGYVLDEKTAYEVIKNGRNGCPAWGKVLTDIQIQLMIKYLKKF